MSHTSTTAQTTDPIVLPATVLPINPTAAQRALWQVVADLNADADIRTVSAIVKTHLKEAGIDLNFRKGPDGKSLIGVALGLSDNNDVGDPVAKAMVGALIHFGANPLLDPKMLRKVINTPFDTQLTWVVEALAKRESAGQGMRGWQGENLFHFLATNPRMLTDYSDAWGMDKHWVSWMNEGDATGRTPIHRALACFRDGKQDDWHWESLCLLGAGFIGPESKIDLELADNEGRTATQGFLSLIRGNEALRAGVSAELYQNLLAREARMAERVLDADTGPAFRTRTGVRL